MGCNSSSSSGSSGNLPTTRTTPSPIHPNLKLVIVGGVEDGNISNRIDIYSAKGCRLVRSIELSQTKEAPFPSHGYSVASREDKLTLYISGGFDQDSNEPTSTFLMLDLTLSDPSTQCQVLPDLPQPVSQHKSCLVQEDGDVKVVIASASGKCFCFSSAQNQWNQLPDLPVNGRLHALLALDNAVLAIVGGAVMSYDIKQDSLGGLWNILMEESYPEGQSVTTGRSIYTWSEKESVLYEFNPVNAQTRKVGGIDPSDVKGPCGMAALGEHHLYFTGSCYHAHQSGVIEYDTRRNVAVVAGYLNHANISHQAFISQQPDEE